MFKSIVCLAIAGLSLTSAVFAKVDHPRTIHPEVGRIIKEVNSADTTWEAGINERFAYVENYGEIKKYLGALKEPAHMKLPTLFHDVKLSAIPEQFDARTAWGRRCPSVNEIRDQSACGSCWAFGAAEVATDRICIQTNGAQNYHVSVTGLLGCCFSCGNGCDGGYPSAAFDWFTSQGFITGGNYGDYSWCSSYPFPPCDHHVKGKYGPCPSTDYNTPSCPSACDAQSTYNISISQDVRKFATSYSISSDVSQIQTEIMTNGPVEAAFDVYADFPTYKSGVYQHVSGSYLGGHAIKILGWGDENGTPYWLVANSWNAGWGDNGFFKILRGSDECGIEDSIVAGKFLNQ